MTHPLGIERTGSFSLPLPATRAFELFTPEGERLWVEGWEPEYLLPATASTEPGTIFRTRHGGDETFWVILVYDPPRETRYARLTPGSRVGTVHVRCEALAAATTTVYVTYALTALGPAGEEVLRGMTAEHYEQMLRQWREAILRALGQPDAPANG